MRFSYLDFSTLKARKHFCEEEIRLNRQLAGKTVYLGTVPLVCDNIGRLKIGGDGRPVDWLVEMLRLPENDMLDRRLAEHRHVTVSEVEALADVLTDFYQRRQLHRQNCDPYVRLLQRESVINARHLHEMREHLGDNYSRQFCEDVTGVIEQCLPEIRGRIEAGHVVEGHGDLRPEHVCLVSPPIIFDRLEFDPDMLLVDIYDEINYLGLECEWLGAPWIRAMLLRHIETVFGAPPSANLKRAYGAFRALLRARLSIDHLRDKDPRSPDKWPRQAKAYLAAARRQFEGNAHLPATV